LSGVEKADAQNESRLRQLVTNCHRFKLPAADGKMKERFGKEISWLQNVTN
jgi:hypothetical protein